MISNSIMIKPRKKILRKKTAPPLFWSWLRPWSWVSLITAWMLVILIHTQTNVILSKQDKMMIMNYDYIWKKLDLNLMCYIYGKCLSIFLLTEILLKKNNMYSCQHSNKRKGILNIAQRVIWPNILTKSNYSHWQ